MPLLQKTLSLSIKFAYKTSSYQTKRDFQPIKKRKNAKAVFLVQVFCENVEKIDEVLKTLLTKTIKKC